MASAPISLWPRSPIVRTKLSSGTPSCPTLEPSAEHLTLPSRAAARDAVKPPRQHFQHDVVAARKPLLLDGADCCNVHPPLSRALPAGMPRRSFAPLVATAHRGSRCTRPWGAFGRGAEVDVAIRPSAALPDAALPSYRAGQVAKLSAAGAAQGNDIDDQKNGSIQADFRS